MISTSIIITKIRKPPYATGPALHDDRPPSRRGATTRPYSPPSKELYKVAPEGVEEKAQSSTALLSCAARTSPEALHLFR